MYNWIASGSLLGWYRQCGAIPYTSDADTASWADDYKDWMKDYFLGKDKGIHLATFTARALSRNLTMAEQFRSAGVRF